MPFIDGVWVLLGGNGATSSLHAVMDLFELSVLNSGGDIKT